MGTLIEGVFVEVHDDEPDRITAQQMCDAAGITYRQLDWWTRTDLIPGVTSRFAPGSGSNRPWTAAQLEFIVQLARLTRAGLPPRLAADLLFKQSVDGVLPSRLVLGGGCRRLAA